MPDEAHDLVTVEQPEGGAPAGVAIIRLNNPPVNALSDALARDLDKAVSAVAGDDSVRAVVVYGGARLFAAGADIKEFEHADAAAVLRDGLPLERAIARLAALPKPVIAAITGYALGGGCEIALAADFRVCGEHAQLGQPEILLGIIPGGGGTQRLPRLVGVARAKDLIYSGRIVKAKEAHEIGLVDAVVDDGEVLSASLAMAGRYATGPRTALAAAKQAIDAAVASDIESGLEFERALFAMLFGTEDKARGVSSFIEQGPGKAVFEGAPVASD
jgi:enoyl-CoA hydratase/carnithine racemase